MANNSKKSGFNAPTIGTRYPKGSKIKKNADGTVSVVTPKSKSKKGGK